MSKHLTTAALFVALIAVPIAGLAQTKAVMLTPAALAWGAGPSEFPPGMTLAVLSGDPSKAGSPFTLRIKMPDGYLIKPHHHTADEALTVMSGTLLVGYGKTVQASTMKALPAGSFFTLPKGMWHYVKTKGVTVLQESGIGPDAGTVY